MHPVIMRQLATAPPSGNTDQNTDQARKESEK